MEILRQDLRYGARWLWKKPGFASVAILILALGIGANTAIFSLIDAVLLKLLPVKNPEQLVVLGHVGSAGPGSRFPYGNYIQFRELKELFSGALAYHPLRMMVSIDGQMESAVSGQLVTGDYYSTLGVGAVLGRTILPDDDRVPGGHPVCVISYSYWQRRFASDPSALGKSILLSGKPFTIIGVTPPEFFGLEIGTVADISVPSMMQTQVMPGIGPFVQRETITGDEFHVMGRLKPGITIEEAHARLSLLYRQFLDDLAIRIGGKSKDNRPLLERRLVLASGSHGLSVLRQQFSQPLLILMAMVGLVLLIACANVASLLLAKATARRKEMSIRLAVGATRARLIKQLLTESLLLAVLGSCIGLLFAYWGMSLLLPLLPHGELPLRLNLGPDVRLLGFTVGLSLLTGVLVGLAPAFRGTSVDLNSTLKDDPQHLSGRGSRMTLGKLFVVSQVALSLILLTGAGLFIRSLQNLRQVDAGFARDNVLVLKLEPIGSDRNMTGQLGIRYDELLERVEAIPGVVKASLVGYSPITRREWVEMGQSPALKLPVTVRGESARPGEEVTIPWMQVYPDSFATLGIQLVAGRDFTPQDNTRSQLVAVINESMAHRLFGKENPLGRRFGYGEELEMEIVGVVKDAKYLSLRDGAAPMFYTCFYQFGGQGQMTLVVRTAGDPTLVAAAVQRETRALDSAMPIFTAETIATQLEASLSHERLVATLSSIFGLLALLLTCIGLYGILSYTVARRTNEIGIRLALGAQPRNVLWLVFRDALLLVVIGIAIGTPVAVLAARLVSSQLFGLSGVDPLTVFSASIILLAVAASASYLPARRATKMDPMIALRHE